ncbi:MAG: SIMPL domain-containing protein [Janthinobacterium lividum]
MRVLVVAGLLGLVGGPVLAEDLPVDRAAGSGLITTHGMARGRLANTVADVSIGVEAHGPTVAATQAALAAGSQKLMGYLRAQGVERLRTDQLSVTPQTAAETGRAARIVGYDGSVQASFRVSAEKVGAVVAGALANGGNNLERTTLGPREAEIDAERARLAAEAAKIALTQADTVAGATGRRLGAIRRIEVDPNQAFAPSAPMMRMAAMPAPPPVATEAGDAEMSASVLVTVELVEPRAP